jgi:uncharacterized protein YjbI with pentapeptide repeats
MANFTREAVIEKVRKGEGLRNAVLYGIDLSNANLRGANLSRANLRSANLMDADLSSADLSGVSLHSADLSSAYLHSANLIDSDLSSAYLRSANLRRADLHNANFHRADLSGANLIGSDLSDANLSGANLSSANLRDADLKNSILISADLEYADLTKADISGANIFHYKIHGWKIEGIKCTHVYSYPLGVSEEEREKSRINFEKGQFEEKYKAKPTLEFLLSGVPQLPDQCKMYYIISEVNKKYNIGLEPASMKKESDGILITLGAKSDENLEEIGHMFVREYKKRDLDSKLLAIIKKENLPYSGTDSSGISDSNIDASNVFKQLLGVKVTLVNKGTVNIIK